MSLYKHALLVFTRNVHLYRISAYPRWGPPFIRSNTCAGFSSCLNLRRNFTPWLSPLFELTKTNKGLVQEGGQVAFQKPELRKDVRGREEKSRGGMRKQTNNIPYPSLKKLIHSLCLWHSLSTCQMCTALNPARTIAHAAKCHTYHLTVCQILQLPRPSQTAFAIELVLHKC